ncbi:MAG: LysR family transcriptional regulator [Spirochaetales bacterium]|nr:LysR family transcriptional regulator [Candidatus Physcosoma equi]
MTLHHLEVFRAVYEEANVTRASEKLFMTQPAVSRAILEMENYYGVKLFERLHRGVSPTEAAHTLYGKAVQILDSFSSLEKGLKDWDEIGVIRLGATITMGNFVLPSVADALKRKHPKLSVRCTVANASIIKEKLMRNELDLAFIEGMVSEKELSSKRYSSDRLVLAVPIDCPLRQKDTVTLSDVAEYPLLTREEGSVTRTLTEWNYAEKNLPFDPVWESESTQAILQAVRRGLGVTFLSFGLVQTQVELGNVAMVEVEDASLVRNNYIVWHRSKYLTDTMKAIIQGEYNQREMDVDDGE